MVYTLKVGDKLLAALNAAGREEVRRILGAHFEIEVAEMRRGRPRRDGLPARKRVPFTGIETPFPKRESIWDSFNKGDSIRGAGCRAELGG